ncbi:MAG: circadian clock KaiB family protein [Methanotrichaceae archaeon]
MICEENMPGRYQLDIIDIYQQPIFAREGQIVAAPNLIEELPLPISKLVGDMSNKERVLVGLDLRSMGIGNGAGSKKCEKVKAPKLE